MKLTRDEFEEMALEHVDMLYRIARRLTRDSSAADDLVQETYLRALRSYESFDLKEYGIRPWLLRIMHNLHASKFKRDKRQPVGVDEELLQQQPSTDGGGGVMPPSTASPGLMWEGMDEQLVAAMESLPEEYQTAMLLWAIDELSYKEIAQALDVPIGTVMSRLFRARQKLSEQLAEFAAKEGILRPQ